MAHFAELDQNNIVIRVIVIDNKDVLDSNGNESESIGIEFCKRLLGENTRWVQTSYNNNFRKRYASIGYKYDENLDAFIRPQPYPSWILNTQSTEWAAPILYPTDGKIYRWDEDTQSWIEVVINN